MGHLALKDDVYKKLGQKIDSLDMRAPWNKAFYDILKELYSSEEAEIITKMPFGLSSLDTIAKTTKYEKSKLTKILDEMSSKGLVLDLYVNNGHYYAHPPFLVGIFEFTMMRTEGNLYTKEWARLFHEYLNEGLFYKANFENDNKISPLRVLPHVETIENSSYIEILDYEKVTSLVEESSKFAVGICSCRHEKHHLGTKECDIPLDTCTSFGIGADYFIRRNLAKEVSKSELLDNLRRSKELGLVYMSDNVQRNIMYLCQCCKCCCNALAGISKHGYPNAVVTSSFIAEVDEAKCIGCGKCAKACPINAITMVPIEKPRTKKKAYARIDTSMCLGCGVCSLQCEKGANKLVKRKQRVIHPSTMFERIILQCLERGTLQNQIFVNPQSISQKFLRGLIGGFLKLTPVKKALMSDMLRSKFLSSMKVGVKLQGKGWLTDL